MDMDGISSESCLLVGKSFCGNRGVREWERAWSERRKESEGWEVEPNKRGSVSVCN
jgi:hypothetical protein